MTDLPLLVPDLKFQISLDCQRVKSKQKCISSLNSSKMTNKGFVGEKRKERKHSPRTSWYWHCSDLLLQNDVFPVSPDIFCYSRQSLCMWAGEIKVFSDPTQAPKVILRKEKLTTSIPHETSVRTEALPCLTNDSTSHTLIYTAAIFLLKNWIGNHRTDSTHLTKWWLKKSTRMRIMITPPPK